MHQKLLQFNVQHIASLGKDPDHSTFSATLIAWRRSPADIQLKSNENGSAFYQTAVTTDVWEIEIPQAIMEWLRKLKISFDRIPVLHIHKGADEKHYVCYPMPITDETTAAAIAKMWLTVTVFTIITGIDPNTLEAFVAMLSSEYPKKYAAEKTDINPTLLPFITDAFTAMGNDGFTLAVEFATTYMQTHNMCTISDTQ